MDKSLFSKQYRIFLSLLRTARVEAGLTQADLAKRIGESQSFVSKVERGERRLDVVELRAFCSALNVQFPKFMKGLHDSLSTSERRRLSGS
jgi:transcriptional regulator with XRE-family HTH domain